MPLEGTFCAGNFLKTFNANIANFVYLREDSTVIFYK